MKSFLVGMFGSLLITIPIVFILKRRFCQNLGRVPTVIVGFLGGFFGVLIAEMLF